MNSESVRVTVNVAVPDGGDCQPEPLRLQVSTVTVTVTGSLTQ
jgi:hypothetical protein